jgi:hypothetical protein
MAEQFSSRTVISTGGLSPLEWIQRYVTNGTFVGETKVAITRMDGKKDFLPLKQVGMVFRDLKLRNKESKGNRGGAPSVMATPMIDLVSLEHGFLATDGLMEHTCVKRKDIIIPIGFPTSVKDQVVFQQCAREWVSCGANNINMHDHHVANMLMSALQCTLWEISNDVSQKVQCLRFDNLVLLVNATNAYFSRYPEAFKVVAPLRDADSARDMLARALAFIFFDEKWNKEELLRILEIMLKRYNKFQHKEGQKEADFITKPIPGIIGCLLVIPLLRYMLKDGVKAEETVKELNAKTEALVLHMCENIKIEKVEERNKSILYKLVQFSDLKDCVSVEQLGKLYDFCMDRKNHETYAPLSSWGLVKETTLPFDFVSTGFCIGGKLSGTVVKIKAREGKEGDPAEYFDVMPSSPADWNAFGLTTPGIYTIKSVIIGAAEQAIGNSQGKVNVANLRFTSGMDVLPKGREGKSSAGIHYQRLASGKWDYSKTGVCLDLSKEFNVTLKDDICYVNQGSLFYSFPTERHPAVIGFKFLKFVISYRDFPKSTNEKVELPVAKEGNEKKGDAVPAHVVGDLTGIALMNKLRELSLNERVNKKEGSS